MPIKLYAVSGSPFAWRVWLALEHKKIPHDVVMLSSQQGDHRKPEYTAINPRQQVPAIDDDGFTLYESGAIVEYLDDRYPEEPWLFPRDVRERALCRRIVREVDDYLAPSHIRLARQLFFKPDPATWDGTEIEAARARFLEELARHEASLRGDFFLGTVSAADFALYPFLAVWHRFEMRKPDLGLCAARGPKIQAWMKRIEELPYHARTYPPHWKKS